jgi:hypothetical protein
VPACGTKIASKTTRAGGAERWPAPAVQPSVEVALALIAADDRRLSDLALAMVKTAQQPDAAPCERRPAVPGLGQRRARGLR